MCASSPVDRRPSKVFQSILKEIDDKISTECEIRLQALAELADLSMSRFKARFRSEIGIPPAEFIARRKVEKASELLLQSNLSITDIAMRLQFGTSQYFATVYKRYTGKSPSQVRAANELPPM